VSASEVKIREGQGIGRGPAYARLLAPSVAGAGALVELAVSMALALGLGYLLRPEDPLMLDMGFPWAWLLPLILALRYGTLVGVGGVLMMLAAWYLFHQGGAEAGDFPRMFFLGGLLLVLVAGQFGDVWGNRLARARAVNRYLDERLSALTKSHYLLRLSHARLENDLLARPTTLRDTLAQMRGAARDADARDGALAGAQAMMQLAAQACQVESAALYPCRGEVPLAEAAARVGPAFDLDPADPLVEACLRTRQAAHLRSEGLQHEAGSPRTRYVAVVPVLAGSDRLLGLLVVERMPFLSLNYENLQLLMVLASYYADGVEHAAATHGIESALPACPHAFALDYARLARLRAQAGVQSSVVALVFDLDEASDAPYDAVVRSRRELDVAWQLRGSRRRALVTLMPLSDARAVSAYLLRIEAMLRAQLGLDLAQLRVGVHSLSVPAEGAVEPLVRMLQRTGVDGEAGLQASPAPAAPAAHAAPAGKAAHG